MEGGASGKLVAALACCDLQLISPLVPVEQTTFEPGKLLVHGLEPRRRASRSIVSDITDPRERNRYGRGRGPPCVDE